MKKVLCLIRKKNGMCIKCVCVVEKRVLLEYINDNKRYT